MTRAIEAQIKIPVDSPCRTRKDAPLGGGEMQQTVIVVEGKAPPSNLPHMNFQAHACAWNTFTGIALASDPNKREKPDISGQIQPDGGSGIGQRALR